MGARALVESQMSQLERSKWTDDEYNLSLAAKLKFYASVDANVSGDYEKKLLEKFEQSISKSHAYFLGSPLDGDWKDWQAMADKEPFPMKYTQRSISSLLTARQFPNMNPTDLQRRKIALIEYLKSYCHNTPSDLPFDFV